MNRSTSNTNNEQVMQADQNVESVTVQDNRKNSFTSKLTEDRPALAFIGAQ